jgi:hypothetical protein
LFSNAATSGARRVGQIVQKQRSSPVVGVNYRDPAASIILAGRGVVNG